MSLLQKIQGRRKSDAQIRDEAIRKQRILQEGIGDEFWHVLRQELEREIEEGRNALESPEQMREKGVGGSIVRNDIYWIQYLRGNLNALRLLLTAPDRLIEMGKFAEEMKTKYNEINEE